MQKIETANNEILHSIKPLVIEKKIPSTSVLSAIKLSIAKKYGVKQEDLFTEFSLSNDLINEIMQNSFLSSEQKIEFCDLLQEMKNRGSDKKEVEIIYLKSKDGLFSKYSSILMAMISLCIALLSTFLIEGNKIEKQLSVFEDKFTILFTAILIPMVAMTSILFLQYLRKYTRNKESEKEKSNRNDDVNKIV